MEIATAVGGAILSSSFHVLFDKFKSPEMVKFARQEQLLPQLDKWQKTLKIIEAVLDDAEEKQMTDRSVEIWLADLRDLAYDVEDILDEFATEALRRNIMEEPQANTSKLQKLIPACCTGFNPSAIKFNEKMGSKIEDITSRLQGIVEGQNVLNLREHIGGRSNREAQRQSTTSLVNEAKVYGRDEDKNMILNLLTAEACNPEVSVIPIQGMGGLGKTTLAQLAYNDDRVTFDTKAWVCVSVHEDFDVSKITKTILDQLEGCDAKDLNSLQVKLKTKLSGKKFLIILDDVWKVEYGDWTLFRIPLEAGAPGSRIIVTTRDRNVSSMLGTIPAYLLKELKYDDCLSLFSQHALGATNFEAYPHLKEIGMRIVHKCKGLPLAAKALGGLLRNKPNLDEWEDILESKIWDLPEEQYGILPVLRLSYHHLPSHLKRCFAYCAIFPQDYEFDEDELVLLWMAEGFLQQPNEKKHVEDLGHDYFRDLLSRSFFQQSSGENTRFVMHDLMHDVALHVAGDISYNLEDKLKGDLSNLSLKKVRHSSFNRRNYDISPRFEVFYQMKGLRTFLALPLVPSWHECYLTSKVLHDLLPKLSFLRALSLSSYEIVDLPTSIGDLKHLRYLNLSYTKIKCLPESVSNLFNLQSLRLRDCTKLTNLPTCLDNLVNLCYLDLRDTYSLNEIPLHIDNLASLQIFTKLPVGKCKGLGNGVLRKLSHLPGKVSTLGWNNVADIQDARAINLKVKYGLKDLELKWREDFHDSRNEQNELQVLDSLQSHRFLKTLKIISYGGVQFPSWISDSSFSNIECIELCGCRKIKSLPPLGRLPLLRTLFIEGMNEVKRVGPEFYGDSTPSNKSFPSLVSLKFENMLEWEYWSWLVSVEDGAKGEFPTLNYLGMKNCPKLVGKIHRSSVVSLEITECPQLFLGDPLAMRELPKDMNGQECSLEGCDYYEESKRLMMRKLPKDTIFEHMHIPRRVLYIEECHTLESFPEDFSIPNQMHNFTSLQHLYIGNCPSIVSFPDGALPSNLILLDINLCENLKQPISEWDLHSLSSLTDFRIRNTCDPDMISFPDDECLWLPTSLTLIDIQNFQNLESLSKGLQHLTSLEELIIRDCPKLRSLPKKGLPTSLGRLEIWKCPLLEERCVEKKGEYWPLIEHIPCLQIGDLEI